MKPFTPRYRIYISEHCTKFYLRDWVICDERDNLIFDADRRYAMKFRSWDAALKYHEKMKALKYDPHIEGA